MIPFALVAAYLGTWYFALLVSIMATLSVFELSQMMEKMKWRGSPILPVLFGFCTPLLLHLFGPVVFAPLLITLILIASIMAMISGLGKGLQALVSTVFSYVLIIVPFSSAVMIRDGQEWSSSWIAAWVIIYIWAGAWLGDTAAFAFGKMFGKHKLAPKISPNKTVEGSIAGIAIAIIWAYVGAIPLGDLFSWSDKLMIGIIIGIVSQVGDLTFSLIKREAGIKDSGKLFPGHGGAVDVFDSMIFISGVMYLFFVATGFLPHP